jgi:DNA-binding XRE family transcriptional regulator
MAHPGGRPSKYDQKYCAEAIQFMRDGYSVTAFAGHIGVARSTVFKWAEENEEFSDALKTAQALAALFWEDRLREVAMTGDGNASAAIFGVKNRSREDWKDKVEQEHTGPDGGPVQFQQVVRKVVDA